MNRSHTSDEARYHASMITPAVYERRLTVVDDDVDLLGHVNNLTEMLWSMAFCLTTS